MKRSFSVWLVAFILSFALIAGGTYRIVDICAKLIQYEKSEGTVVKLVVKGGDRYDPDRDVIYYPQIRYFDRSGREYTIQLTTGAERPLAKEGEKIELYINPNDPKEVLINSFMYLWVGPTLFLLAGLVFFAIIATVKYREGK